MPEAYIYDHVRTPRGRGTPDGAPHEETALALATAPLKALRERNNLAEDVVDDVVLGVVDPVGEAGSDIARFAAIKAGLGESVPGVQISRFCASGLDAVNFAAAQIMSGQHELTIGGGAESMSRVGIGASGGAWPMDPSIAVPAYFMPQGVSADLIATKYGFSRDDVDADAVARSVAAVICDSRADGRLRCGGDPVASGNRAPQLCAPRRQLVGNRRWRRRGPARQQGGRGEAWPEAARKNPRLHQYRLGTCDDADRSGRCD